MKSFITSILAVVLFSVIACSQTKVPEKVADAFKAKFPSAQKVEWGKESASEFEAEFRLNGNEMSANFDASGKWLETEAKLTKDDLPAPVLATLKSQFGDSKIKKAESLEKAGEAVVYEVKLEQDEAELEVVLDSNGNVIKKEAKGEEKEQKEMGEKSEQEEAGEHGEEAEEQNEGTEKIAVPKTVTVAFKAKYSAAQKVEWGKESDTEFEAEFKLNGKEMSANFDANGTWLETEAKLAPKDLPAPVLATLKSQFADSKIKKAESLDKAGEAIVYEVKLEQDEAEMEVILNASGKVLKKEAKGEEKEQEKGEENEQEEGHERGEKG